MYFELSVKKRIHIFPPVSRYRTVCNHHSPHPTERERERQRQGKRTRTFLKDCELTAGAIILYGHTQTARLHDEKAATCTLRRSDMRMHVRICEWIHSRRDLCACLCSCARVVGCVHFCVCMCTRKQILQHIPERVRARPHRECKTDQSDEEVVKGQDWNKEDGAEEGYRADSVSQR